MQNDVQIKMKANSAASKLIRSLLISKHSLSTKRNEELESFLSDEEYLE